MTEQRITKTSSDNPKLGRFNSRLDINNTLKQEKFLLSGQKYLQDEQFIISLMHTIVEGLIDITAPFIKSLRPKKTAATTGCIWGTRLHSKSAGAAVFFGCCYLNMSNKRHE
ncbi:MAG TPA: hypothetical protein VFZ42_07800 [Chitinophagaceae bacterium]